MKAKLDELKRPISRLIIINLMTAKNKERILKAAREKRLITYKDLRKTIGRFFIRTFGGPKTLGRNIFKVLKKVSTKNSISGQTILQN